MEKSYDRLPTEALWKALEMKKVHIAFIKAIKDMYDAVMTSVRTKGDVRKDFPITTELHQRSSLSPFVFILVLDVLI